MTDQKYRALLLWEVIAREKARHPASLRTGGAGLAKARRTVIECYLEDNRTGVSKALVARREGLDIEALLDRIDGHIDTKKWRQAYSSIVRGVAHYETRFVEQFTPEIMALWLSEEDVYDEEDEK